MIEYENKKVEECSEARQDPAYLEKDDGLIKTLGLKLSKGKEKDEVQEKKETISTVRRRSEEVVVKTFAKSKNTINDVNTIHSAFVVGADEHTHSPDNPSQVALIDGYHCIQVINIIESCLC